MTHEDFFSSLTIEELADAQGVRPIDDIGILGGLINDDELDAFLEEMHQRELAEGGK